jgi:hypothetical protein
VFEHSHRYIASLTAAGGVEVWNLRAKEPEQIWSLSFNSVRQIESSRTENQFYLSMNSADDAEGPTDSLLLFQFSRAQNLVFTWKFKKPILGMIAIESTVVVVNTFKEI